MFSVITPAVFSTLRPTTYPDNPSLTISSNPISSSKAIWKEEMPVQRMTSNPAKVNITIGLQLRCSQLSPFISVLMTSACTASLADKALRTIWLISAFLLSYSSSVVVMLSMTLPTFCTASPVILLSMFLMGFIVQI